MKSIDCVGWWCGTTNEHNSKHEGYGLPSVTDWCERDGRKYETHDDEDGPDFLREGEVTHII